MQKFKKDYLIRSAECDKKGCLRLRSLFNLFQNSADLNAEELGFGYTFCLTNKLTWMGTSYSVKINRLPTRDETVTLYTWPVASSSITAERDFEMKDSAGNTLITAVSHWALIDLNRLRPVSVQKYLTGFNLPHPSLLQEPYKKILLPSDFLVTTDEIIRQDDIDINHHVNNAVYPSLILDAFEESFLNTHTLKELQVQFKTGATKENKVAIFTKIEDNTSYHLIATPDKAIEFARVSALWAYKEE